MSDATSSAVLKWQTCPALVSPWKGAFALLVVAGLAWGTASVSESRLAGLAAAVGLILVLHRFFFPSAHVIDGEGVHVATLFKRESLAWDRIQSVSHDRTRVYVATRASGGGRGILLLLKQNSDEVLSVIRSYRAASKSTDA